ncbi:A disintegrin and metalloproteinase with thrombospondin motifs 20 [Halotydeus destructor]|nr:A disintegrin and metalloproteinase with thrombospondin motifs 20 [Halotydeus destructor]
MPFHCHLPATIYLVFAALGVLVVAIIHVPSCHAQGIGHNFTSPLRHHRPVLALIEESEGSQRCYLERRFQEETTPSSVDWNATGVLTGSPLLPSHMQSSFSHQGRTRRSYSHERHIELMIVADPKMARYHGDNLRQYILTLMATVALIYRDASIGNAINIAIVKLIIMDENEGRDIIYNSAAKTLRHFCRWQQMHNHPSDAHPAHHDAAILLTREDLCRMPKTCDTLGLAQLGQICDLTASCAVIEDNGLSAAFTIAHELAHVLNIPHDDTDKCAVFRAAEGQNQHIMSRMLDYNSHPWTWSTCSRHYLTEFLDGECLLDEPSVNLLRESLIRSDLGEFAEFRQPGELFDMDYQCELVFGPTSKICPYMPVCKRLWCTIGHNGGCRTQHMPWADGTSCGRDKWCLKGECVAISQTSSYPVDGQWGDWSQFTPCSRDCAGGVQKATRDCDHPRPSNGGKYCVGHRVRYRSCNTQECPPGYGDFREQQCSAFNGKSFDIQGLPQAVRWSAHYTGISSADACKLYCNVVGTSAYYLLKNKVIDGTPCLPDSYDVCVNGRCEGAGCDHSLGSDKRPDSCGVCGGDNSTCRLVSGRFDQKRLHYGYNQVTKLPTNSTHIDIRQFARHKDDTNYLALKDAHGKYILNGDFVVSMFRKTIQFGSTTIEYSGSSAQVERINASKPIERDLYVEVLSVGTLQLPEISYQYSTSMDSGNEISLDLAPAKASGIWEKSEWEECSKECGGGGFQRRHVWCISPLNYSRIGDEHCDKSQRLPHAQTCNEHPCPEKSDFRWYIGPWTKVSPTFPTFTLMLITDLHLRLVLCISSKEEKVALRHCGDSAPEMVQACLATVIRCPPGHTVEPYSPPATTTVRPVSTSGRPTNRYPPATSITSARSTATTTTTTTTTPAPILGRWVYSDWEPCSVISCGEGTQTRRPVCVGVGQSSPNCPAHLQPSIEKRMCSKQCPVFSWHAGQWSSCSVKCGRGVMTRSIECLDWTQTTVDDHHCAPGSKPKNMKRCIVQDCSFTWRTSHWTDCSKYCGPGFETRKVTCHRVDQDGSIHAKPVRKRKGPLMRHTKSPIASGWCNESERPTFRRLCNYGSCDGVGAWSPQPWQPCSADCGNGIQKRRVPCINPETRKRIGRSLCKNIERPIRKRKCSVKPCSSNNISCLEIYNRDNHLNGEYDMWSREKLIRIHCSGMTDGHPHHDYLSGHSEKETARNEVARPCHYSSVDIIRFPCFALALASSWCCVRFA